MSWLYSNAILQHPAFRGSLPPEPQHPAPSDLASPTATSALHSMVHQFCYSSFRQVFIRDLPWSVAQQFWETSLPGLPSSLLPKGRHPVFVVAILLSLRDKDETFKPTFHWWWVRNWDLGLLQKHANVLIYLLAISMKYYLNYRKKEYLSLILKTRPAKQKQGI